MEKYDLVIVGGGISGLYAAWRLGKDTDLKILLLESTDRYGGRFHTVTMPGGYKADLGAMRFVPKLHKVLCYLVDEMGVDSVEMASTAEPKNTLPLTYLQGQRANNFDEQCRILRASAEDESLMCAVFPHLAPDFVADDDELVVPADGNYAEAIVKRTGQKAGDLSVSQFLALSDNPNIVRLGDIKYPPGNWPLADSAQKMSQIRRIFIPGFVFRIIGGYGRLADVIVEQIGKLGNVDMRLDHEVVTVDEPNYLQYVIKAKHNGDIETFQSDKILLACATTGLRKILFTGPYFRHQNIQHLLDKTFMLPAIKVFMTYRTAWWEQYGFFFGAMNTDLPSNEAMALGEAAKVGGFATLLATYTFRDIEVFESLDRPHYKRFENTEGDILDEQLIPSERLVEYCEKSLCALLGCDSPPERPVCVVRKYWGRGASHGISQPTKPGVNSNKLHWQSLKPFQDADIFIASDCFTASDPNMNYVGFAETSLLTTERILVNYFGLNSVRDDLCLIDPWP